MTWRRAWLFVSRAPPLRLLGRQLRQFGGHHIVARLVHNWPARVFSKFGAMAAECDRLRARARGQRVTKLASDRQTKQSKTKRNETTKEKEGKSWLAHIFSLLFERALLSLSLSRSLLGLCAPDVRAEENASQQCDATQWPRAKLRAPSVRQLARANTSEPSRARGSLDPRRHLLGSSRTHIGGQVSSAGS